MTAAQFHNTVSVTEELGVLILAARVREHPDDERPVQTAEVPWGAEVYTMPTDGAVVDVPMDPPARIIVEGVSLEYKAGAMDVDGNETLFFSVRMLGEIKATRRAKK